MIKKKALFLIPSLGYRGANVWFEQSLSKTFIYEYECVLVIPNGNSRYEKILKRSGVKIIQTDIPWWVTSSNIDHWVYSVNRIPQAVSIIQKIIQDEQIDVIFTNAGVSPIGAFAAVLEGKPHIWFIRELYKNKATNLSFPPGLNILSRIINETSTTVISVSKEVNESLSICGEAIHKVVPSGIDSQLLCDISQSYNSSRFVALGATSKEKGLEDILMMSKILNEEGIQHCIDIYGDFDSILYKKKIYKMLNDMQVGHSVRLNNHTDIVTCMSDSLAVICASHAESFGRSLVEGMFSGLPVISTSCGGPNEIIIDGETGFLTEVGDFRKMAQKAKTLLLSENTARKMGEKGKKRALKYYDIEISTKKVVNIINESIVKQKESYKCRELLSTHLFLVEEISPRILIGKKWKIFQLFRKMFRLKR